MKKARPWFLAQIWSDLIASAQVPGKADHRAKKVEAGTCEPGAQEVTPRLFTSPVNSGSIAEHSPPAAQRGGAGGHKASHDESRKTKSPATYGTFREIAAGCDIPNKYLLPPVGAELPLDSAEKLQGAGGRGTESGTLSGDLATIGQGDGGQRRVEAPDLADVVKAWPAMPEPIKAGILAMVKAASGAHCKG